jgi:hypothetical protein
MAEFCEALERALGGMGLDVKASATLHQPANDAPAEPEASPAHVSPEPEPTSSHSPLEVETDLQDLAGETNQACELFFYSRLRTVVQTQLNGTPVVLRFRGLRGCVKQLTGAKRWSRQCQQLQEQILDYLRTCLNAEPHRESCLLVVE